MWFLAVPVVDHSLYHLNVEGLSPATAAGTLREKICEKSCIALGIGQGLDCLTFNRRSSFQLKRQLCNLASDCGTLVEYSPKHPKVQGVSPATTTGIGREKNLWKNCITLEIGLRWDCPTLHATLAFRSRGSCIIWPSTVAQLWNTCLIIPWSRVQVHPQILV